MYTAQVEELMKKGANVPFIVVRRTPKELKILFEVESSTVANTLYNMHVVNTINKLCSKFNEIKISKVNDLSLKEIINDLIDRGYTVLEVYGKLHIYANEFEWYDILYMAVSKFRKDVLHV